MPFCQQTRKTLKYHLVTVKPSFTVKMINCMHQTGPTGRKLEIQQHINFFTHTLDVYQVGNGYIGRCDKIGVILHQTCSEN